MTIREFIIKNELPSFEERLRKLREIGAPEIVIKNQSKLVEEMGSGILRIGGSTEKLDNEMIGFEMKKGRGGKTYVVFSDGTQYFPNAQYGRYIK